MQDATGNKDITDIIRKNPSYPYSKKFVAKIAAKNAWQKKMGEIIAIELAIKSVAEFGSGSGWLLAGMLAAGVKNAIGFDIARDAGEAAIAPEARGITHQQDLGVPVKCAKHDLAVSIEVAEHVLPECSTIFATNMTNAASKYIIFQAAVPGQNGSYHINTRPVVFWIEEFRKLGWEKDCDLTKTLAQAILKGCNRVMKPNFFVCVPTSRK